MRLKTLEPVVQKFKFSKTQIACLNALKDPNLDAVCFGGARGGGKSVLGCIWAYMRCWDIINQYGIQPSKFPIQVGFIGRKQSVDFSNSTLETWKRFIPSAYYSLRTSESEIIIGDRVKIQYGGFDSTDKVRKFLSAEYSFAFIDQAEELSRDDFGMVRATLRQKFGDKQPDYKILLTANPADNWLKFDFITTKQPRTKFIKSLPTENPFLAEGYVETLRESFKHRPELLRAYVEGDWDVLTGHDIVIKPEWLDQAMKMDVQRYNDKRRIVSCDVARFGKDETVIYVMEGAKVIDQLIYGQKDLMETCGHLVALKRKHNAQRIIVDVGGVGGGLADRLAELGESVIQFNGAEKPSNELLENRFRNKRTEMYFWAGQKFADGEVALHNDLKLRNQLANLKYKIGSNGALQLESKDDVVKRSEGDSPDRADAFVMGLYGLQFVPVIEQEVWRQEYSGVRRNQLNKPTNTYGWQAPKGNRLPVARVR
jgi:phage terminase large subunit